MNVMYVVHVSDLNGHSLESKTAFWTERSAIAFIENLGSRVNRTTYSNDKLMYTIKEIEVRR